MIAILLERIYSRKEKDETDVGINFTLILPLSFILSGQRIKDEPLKGEGIIITNNASFLFD